MPYIAEEIEGTNLLKIPEWAWDEANKRVLKFNRKAKRNNLPLAILIERERITEEETITDVPHLELCGPRVVIHHYVIAQFEAQVLKVDGYKVVGAVDFSHSEPVVDMAPGYEGTELHDTDNHCDHCNRNRNRKSVVILDKEDGTRVQIGRSCVRDYFGHDIKAELTYWRSLKKLTGELEDEDGYRMGGRDREGAESLGPTMVLAAYAVMNHGWMSGGKVKKAIADADWQGIEYKGPSSTSSVVSDWQSTTPSHKCEHPRPSKSDITDEVRDLATQAIEWAQNITDNEAANSDYMHKIRVIARDGWFKSWREFGTAVSIVGVFYMNQQKAKAEAAEASGERVPFTFTRPGEHVGEVKVRVTLTLKVISIYWISGTYGETGIHRMVDEEGRSFTWFCSGKPLEEGLVYQVKATVKKHDEYKGVKQTIVNRVTPIAEGQAQLSV